MALAVLTGHQVRTTNAYCAQGSYSSAVFCVGFLGRYVWMGWETTCKKKYLECVFSRKKQKAVVSLCKVAYLPASEFYPGEMGQKKKKKDSEDSSKLNT